MSFRTNLYLTNELDLITTLALIRNPNIVTHTFDKLCDNCTRTFYANVILASL